MDGEEQLRKLDMINGRKFEIDLIKFYNKDFPEDINRCNDYGRSLHFNEVKLITKYLSVSNKINKPLLELGTCSSSYNKCKYKMYITLSDERNKFDQYCTKQFIK